MTRLHACEPVGSVPRDKDAGRALFLHTGWRSAGTWIWSRCREQVGMHGFYEPLHEDLAWLRPSDITALRPGAWASNHSETAPYFQEYAKLLKPGTAGVSLYRRRFAFDRFFLSPEEDDPELETYLRALLAAVAPDRAGVLKFCRSLGRVGWLERRFPHALHLLLLRDPVSQFASAQALLARQRNRYFAIAPVIVLARNAAHPLVRQANAALGVRPPELLSDDPAYVTETCWRHVRRCNAGERYRQFLAFWAATALTALQSEARLLELRRLARDATYRQDMEAAVGEVAGPGLSLVARTGGAFGHVPPLPAAELDEVHLAASLFLRACGGALSAGRLEAALDLLTGEASSPAPRVMPVAALPAFAALPAPRQPQARHGLRRRALVVALVVAARALQPVRRLHGRMVRWQGRLPGRSAGQIT